MDLLLKYSPDKQIENYAFSLSACIGKGSSGTVYVGKHQQTQQVVAIKAVDMRSLKTEYAWKMLCSEVKIMKKLKHPHVVRLLDVFQTKNNTYIITEFCNQGDLRTYLKKKKQLTERESITVISQIMSGLQELANNGIIHRDLKPANILIHDDVFKITDFGFAKKLDSMEDQLMDSLVGTPLYMAPQILNKQQYTSKCDVWSVGLILYELLYGRTPWPAVNVVDLVQKMCTIPLNFPKDPLVSQQLTSFISKCLQFPEADRISIQEMCANQLFEDYVLQINRLLSQQKLQSQQSSGTSTNTSSNVSNNLTDFASVATQVQNTQKNNSTNEPNTPGLANNRSSKQSQMNQGNQIIPQQENRSNPYVGQQQVSGTNLGVTPSSGMNLQINLNINPQPPQQSSSMSPVRMHNQQQPISGRNTDRNAIIQDQSGGYSPIKQISNMVEPYSPISPVRANYQKQSSTSSHHQQAKSMSALQEQIVSGNVINSSQKNMSNSKNNPAQYLNQPKNYPSSFHNLNAAPQLEPNIQSSEGSNNLNLQQQPLSNNYTRQEKDVSPAKGQSYNETNFYQLLNNANTNEKNQTTNDIIKNQAFGYSSNHSKHNSTSSGVPLSNQNSQNNQMVLQKQITNERNSSPSPSPPILQYQPHYPSQSQNSPPLQFQQKPELKAEVMSSNNQQINSGLVSPYKQQDSNDRKFQERGFFLQQVQDQSPISNQNSETKNGGIYLQQQISQPYAKTQDIQSGNQDLSGNNQNKYEESSSKQPYNKQYSLQYQYQFSKQNGQSDFNTQTATPQRNISPQSHSKNQSTFTSEKNSSSEQSPSSSLNQHAGSYNPQLQQPQIIQNRLSQQNNSNSASGYSTIVKSGDHSSQQDHVNSRTSSPSNCNPPSQQQQQQNIPSSIHQVQQQQQQQQNQIIQQLQQQRSGGDSPEGRYKNYSFTASNGFYSSKSGGALNNTNTSTRSITATNNSNSSPKNTESESKNSFNSTGYHSHQQQQIINTRNPSNTLAGYSNTEQADIAAYKNMKFVQQHQTSGQRKDFESVIQAPNESSGTNLNHQNAPYFYKRSMTQYNDQQDIYMDNSKNTFTPKNNGGGQIYNNYQNNQGLAQNEFRTVSPTSAAQLLLKKNNETQQLPRSPLQRRRKSEYGIGLSNRNAIFQKETKTIPLQQFSQNQIQNHSRNQQELQIQSPQITNLGFQKDDENRRNPIQNYTSQQSQYNRSRSLHHNVAKQSNNITQVSPVSNVISPKYQNTVLSEIKKPRVSPPEQDHRQNQAGFFSNNTSSPKAQTKYQAYLQSTQQIKNQLTVNQTQNNSSAQKQLQSGQLGQQRINQGIIQNQEQSQQQQLPLQKQISSQGTESSPYKYSKYALKNYLQSQSNQSSSGTPNNNSYSAIQNNPNTNNSNSIPNYTQGSSSNIGLKAFNTQENIGNPINNRSYISQLPSSQIPQQGVKNQAVDAHSHHHHGHSKSLTMNNFSTVITTPNSQQEISINENTNINNQNEFYTQDNMIESILCLCKSVRFLKNQIDYNIKSILKLDEPFLYEKLIFLLNKHLVIQISMLKITQMDKGINVINLDRWTEYRASQNFNEIYKKIAQNYYDIISTHQNNWNRAHENQRFYDEAKKDYYFSKIFNQQLTQYNNTSSGQNSSNQNSQSSDEDNTNFYFYIYQLLKEIIKEVFNKLQHNLSKYLDLDNSKISREDSLVINCLSRLVDYHQLLKLIISQKEDFSLILKSINIAEFLKEKIITMEFYESLKQKMYIYDLISK